MATIEIAGRCRKTLHLSKRRHSLKGLDRGCRTPIAPAQGCTLVPQCFEYNSVNNSYC